MIRGAEKRVFNSKTRRRNLVSSKTLFCQRAFAHWIAESADVTGGHQNLRHRQNRAVHAEHVVALLHGLPPPVVLQIALQLRAERAVVPAAVEAAVKLSGLENEAAAFAQRHDFFHAGGIGDIFVGHVFERLGREAKQARRRAARRDCDPRADRKNVTTSSLTRHRVMPSWPILGYLFPCRSERASPRVSGPRPKHSPRVEPLHGLKRPAKIEFPPLRFPPVSLLQGVPSGGPRVAKGRGQGGFRERIPARRAFATPVLQTP